jgi:hypothetical protein
MRRLVRMLVILLTLEVLVTKAICDLLSAVTHAPVMTLRGQDRMEWSLIHSFYANMGGLIIQFTEDTPRSGKASPLAPAPSKDPVLPVQKPL